MIRFEGILLLELTNQYQHTMDAVETYLPPSKKSRDCVLLTPVLFMAVMLALLQLGVLGKIV